MEQKTKDPKYKKLWYKLVEEMHGTNNFKRRILPTDSNYKTDDGSYVVLGKRNKLS